MNAFVVYESGDRRQKSGFVVGVPDPELGTRPCRRRRSFNALHAYVWMSASEARAFAQRTKEGLKSGNPTSVYTVLSVSEIAA